MMMGDDRDGARPGEEQPGGERPENGQDPPAPDLAALLTAAVRSAALELPRDRVPPVVYAVDPSPGDHSA